MKNIGIITLFGLSNYGNRLQAYALYRVIEKLNCKPVNVLYANRKKVLLKTILEKNEVSNRPFLFYQEITKKNTIGVAIKECKRLKLFSVFSRKIKSKIFLRDKNTIDYYVCGSDQIWNPNFAGQSGYFAAFAKKEKRISYAASFGITNLPEKVVNSFKIYLADMQYISVREDAGVHIVKELTGKDAQVVIDPTLMLDAEEWMEVSQKPKYAIPGKYILTYFLGDLSENTDSYIKKIAKENSLEIIDLNFCDKGDYWYKTGPAEFIWLIENASLMCTDSFHGSVFSILMETPFVAFKRNGKADMQSRFDSLLGMFKLTDRFAENVKEGDELTVDYSHVPEILSFERKKATNFLTKALEL